MNKIVLIAFLTFTCLFRVECTDVAKDFTSFMQEKFCKAKDVEEKNMFTECAAMLPRTGLQIMKEVAVAKSVFGAFEKVCKDKEVAKKVCDALKTRLKETMDEEKRKAIMECMASNNLEFNHGNVSGQPEGQPVRDNHGNVSGQPEGQPVRDNHGSVSGQPEGQPVRDNHSSHFNHPIFDYPVYT